MDNLLSKIESKHGQGKATKSFLRQEAVLRNNSNTYNFDFAGNVNGQPSESRLAVQDLFYADKIALFLLREADNQPGSGALRTFVDSAVFVAAVGFTPAHLESIYNGFIRAEMGKKVVIEKHPTLKMRKVPTEFVQPDIFDELKPSLILHGNEKNRLSLILPNFNGIQIESVTDGTSNKVVMVLDGYLVAGAI